MNERPTIRGQRIGGGQTVPHGFIPYVYRRGQKNAGPTDTQKRGAPTKPRKRQDTDE